MEPNYDAPSDGLSCLGLPSTGTRALDEAEVAALRAERRTLVWKAIAFVFTAPVAFVGMLVLCAFFGTTLPVSVPGCAPVR